jgi:alkanesulfonate monooxygenase SsuD/methylene tetrahydromethanopterin reductase-like flavin-dependent oxidoreductase (luciferase family)
MVAQYAEEWNVWSTPEIMAHKAKVLDEHCERLERDPATVQRSAVALLFLCDTEADAAARREAELPRPSLIGTPAPLQEHLAAYADLGVDEVIIPDFNLGRPERKDGVADRFLAEVAAPFRDRPGD